MSADNMITLTIRPFVRNVILINGQVTSWTNSFNRRLIIQNSDWQRRVNGVVVPVGNHNRQIDGQVIRIRCMIERARQFKIVASVLMQCQRENGVATNGFSHINQSITR